MDNNDFLKSLSKSLIEATKTILEGKSHTVPKTEKEKNLAALAHPKDKITHADVLKGRGVVKEAEMDGVAAGSMEGEKHMCATKVFHKEWKEGTPVKTMHADPDENGLIEWYDVMFDHGIERVMTEDMKILQQESHMHAKRKMRKEDVDQIDELSTPTLRKYREKARDDAFDADAVDDERRLRKRSFGHNQAGKKIIKRGDTLRAEEVDHIDERWSENSKKTSKNLAAMALDTGNVATGGLLSKSKLAKKAMKWADSPDETTSKSRLKAYQARQARKANEEVQIDELSKKTLASYIGKAATSAANKASEFGRKSAERDEMDRMMNRHMKFSDKEDIHKKMGTTYRDVEEPREKVGKRVQGIKRATARLAKEEVQIDEAMNAADRFKHHHDHAKALLKSISDHLKAEHEAATKHTDYRGNKGPHWGHVGSMEHVANQLSNIHDMLARKGEYAESVEVEDEVTLTEAELQALEQIAETIEVEETEELDEARGRPKLPRDAQGNIIRGGAKAKASVAKADEEPAALGYQLRKAASINKPVHFMNGEKKNVTSHHINAFNDHMAARKTAAEKAAFQAKAHKSHDEFVKAVSAPVPKATKDTGEIVKYRH